MKHRPWKFKLVSGGIEYYKIEYDDGSHIYAYYWYFARVNKKMRTALRKYPPHRAVGLHKFWYDCAHAQLNLYWFCLCWSSPWTVYKDE